MSPAVAPSASRRAGRVRRAAGDNWPARDAPRSASICAAAPAHAEAIHALIADHRVEGHLLPRTLDDIRAHAHRFVVALDADEVIGCADLAPLSRTVAEIRSLVVDRDVRSTGLGHGLIDELTRRATAEGFETLCAFTHSAAYFVRMGFSIVPHAWLPEKIAIDCGGCPHFRQCGQYAVMLPLARSRHSCVPLASLHG